MSANLQSLVANVGVPTVVAIVLFAVGIFVRNLPLGVRILIFVAAAAMSVPGFFALYLLAIFSSLGHT